MSKRKDVMLKVKQVMGAPIRPPVHFAMVNMAALEGINELLATPKMAQAARLLMVLIRHMTPGSGGVVVCSRETMRELLGVSMPTVERALRALIDGKWVHRMRIGGAHALAINRAVAWVGPRGDMQHAVFEATVIASRSEQDAAGLDPGPLRPIPITASDELAIPYGEGLPPPSQRILDGMAAVPTTAQGIERDPNTVDFIEGRADAG